MSVSSAEIAIFSVKAYGGGSIGSSPYYFGDSTSFYMGVVWNLWNAKDYIGPFVSISMGRFALFGSPKERLNRAWGISMSHASSGISATYTYYDLDSYVIENGDEKLVATLTVSASAAAYVGMAAVLDVNPATAVAMIAADISLWYQTSIAKYYYNRKYEYTPRERQKSKRPKHFFSGPGEAFLATFHLL